MCNITSPDFCERSKFEVLVGKLENGKQIKCFQNFISKKFPKAITSKNKTGVEFEYYKLGIEDLRVLNMYLSGCDV